MYSSWQQRLWSFSIYCVSLSSNVNIERWRKFIHSSAKGGALIYLSNSGHYLHRDDAKFVAGTIKMMIETLNE